MFGTKHAQIIFLLVGDYDNKWRINFLIKNKYALIFVSLFYIKPLQLKKTIRLLMVKQRVKHNNPSFSRVVTFFSEGGGAKKLHTTNLKPFPICN